MPAWTPAKGKGGGEGMGGGEEMVCVCVGGGGGTSEKCKVSVSGVKDTEAAARADSAQQLHSAALSASAFATYVL